MQVAERKTRHGNFISSYIHRGRPHPHSDRSGQEQITLIQPYKGYFIEGSALLVHPFTLDCYEGGSVLVPGRSGSGGMVRAGGCAARGGRMPGSAGHDCRQIA
jgi:hypothetical protein